MSTQSYWDKFLKYIGAARPKLEDAWVPVALICVQPTEVHEDGSIDIDSDKDLTVVWPADVPMDARKYILQELSGRYRGGPVLQSRYKL